MKSLRMAGLAVMVVAVLAIVMFLPGTQLNTVQRAAAQAAVTGTPGAVGGTSAPIGTAAVLAPAVAGTPTPGAATSSAGAALQTIGDLQTTLEQIYDNVNPSVVNIQVSAGTALTSTGQLPSPRVPRNRVTPEVPNMPGTPNPHGPNGALPLPMQGLGSGFVWDNQGHIVTNNHVVEGADRIMVTFTDGASVEAKLVGRDPDSDLAVIAVDPTGLTLHPITMGDSTQARAGQFAVAIGNPFGLEGTMTFGIVSALGRSLPTQQGNGMPGLNQPTYTIPDVIQTDAPINPGNSGGVLVDLQGRLIGVPSAIESAMGTNSGVGFAIPAAIVKNVVPSLIQTGTVQHPYLGISGTTLGPDLAQAMGLSASQRGALVVDVTQGGPAEKAGVQGSTKTVTINGFDRQVGGDVIVRIDNQQVTRFEDLPSYLARSTKVGQAVTLTVLRNGQQTTLTVTLGNRPSSTGAATAESGQATPRAGSTAQATPGSGLATPQAGMATPATPQAGQGTLATPQAGQGTPWLGVSVINLTSEVAQAMNLNASQQGVLIENVALNSPADQAGLHGSTRSLTTAAGDQILIGGDVIVAVDGTNITDVQGLNTIIRGDRPGQKITVTVMRGGNQVDVAVTLQARPTG